MNIKNFWRFDTKHHHASPFTLINKRATDLQREKLLEENEQSQESLEKRTFRG